MAQTKKVSEKSTKQELWQAYDELMAGMNTLPIEFSAPKKEEGKENFIKNITDLKLSIGDNLDRIANDLLKSLNAAETFRLNLEKEKAQISENISFKKQALETEIARIQQDNIDEENNYQKSQELIQKEKEIERKREQDEYVYNLSIKRRKETDDYQAQKTLEIAKLQEREEAVLLREKEITQLEKTVADMPKTLEDSIAQAKSEVTKELTAKFTAEISAMKIESGHQKDIRDLKEKNLESIIKSQEAEIAALKKQFADANSQLKEMAVTVIEGGSNKDKNPTISPMI